MLITQLNTINHINLFLTELKYGFVTFEIAACNNKNKQIFNSLHLVLPREEDTTSSMYPRPEGSPIGLQLVSGQKKVDVVCDALRSMMESMDPNK